MSHSTPDQNQQQNTEQWRDIPGYEGYYQVSDLGRVKRLTRPVPRGDSTVTFLGRVLKTMVSKRGYYQATLSKDGVARPRMVHRLVMLAFVGNLPRGYHTHHVDGDALNNRLSNLVYIPEGRHIRQTNSGIKAPSGKLTLFLVKLIRIRLAKGVPTRQLAREYGVAQHAIMDIKTGKTWGNV